MHNINDADKMCLRNCARTLHPSDIPGITRLASANIYPDLLSLIGFAPDQNHWQHQIFDDPDYEPELARGIFRNKILIGAIIAVRRPWKKGREQTGFIKWLGVHQDHLNDEIGDQLLDMIESELRFKGVTKLVYGSSSPRYLLPGVPQKDKITRDILHTNNWTESSLRTNLLGDLKNIKLTTAIPTLHSITTATPDDREKLLNFIEQNFSLSWAIECENVFRSASPAFACLARSSTDNTIVGFCAFGATNPCWLGPMGVKLPYRNRGYGQALLMKTMQTAQQSGLQIFCIPWANETFYTKYLINLSHSRFLKYEKEL
jgi:predicted N-acetyltransferase YhbS